MEQQRNIFVAYFFPCIALLLYIFLYLPIIVLVLFSFQQSEFTIAWDSFSLRWYRELFASYEIWDALVNSLTVACCTVILSVLMGILLIFYSNHMSFFRKSYVLFYGNLAIPEIVLAVGMLSFFSYFSFPLGLTTLIAGHTLLGLGYVIPIIHSQFLELDIRYMEASLDLGATQGQTFLKIILPLLWPSILAASLLVFIISLDDFLISFFCSGASTQTLPMYIFAMLRSGASPVVSAVSTLLLGISSIFVLIFSSLHVKRMDVKR